MHFGQVPESPFRDERVRQAWSMSWDRDLFIDVTFDVSKYEADGLAMETAWSSCLPCTTWSGWWLDPKDKDFGPNAKYYKQDLAEARRLLAAAGFSNGVDVNARFPAAPFFRDNYYKTIEILSGMAQEAGFRITNHQLGIEDRVAILQGRGRFEGLSYGVDAGGPEPANYLFTRYHPTGSWFYGFDADGKSTFSGDPEITSIVEQMRREFDDKKRMQLAFDVQRHEGKKMYSPLAPGGANQFEVAWPAVRGREVWQGVTSRNFAYLWLDPNRAPLKSA
jgi:ABC-type transport system substrate-binding protein